MDESKNKWMDIRVFLLPIRVTSMGCGAQCDDVTVEI